MHVLTLWFESCLESIYSPKTTALGGLQEALSSEYLMYMYVYEQHVTSCGMRDTSLIGTRLHP